MVKVVVATIGDPSRYQKVIYAKGDAQKSTRLAPLALAGMEGADRVWLIAGLSLFKPGTDAPPPAGPRDIGEAAQQVKRDVWKYAKECCEETHVDCSRVDVVAAPNVFGTNFVSASREDPFFPYVYYQLYQRLDETKGEVSEIVLDTTHGINYMPMLTLEALRLAAAVYSIKYRKEVKIDVYNTEPVVPGNAGPYHYMKILEETVTPKSAVATVTARYLNRKRDTAAEKTLPPDTRTKIEPAARLARALYNGLYLYVAIRGQYARKTAQELAQRLQHVEIATGTPGGAVTYTSHPTREDAYLHALLQSTAEIAQQYGHPQGGLCLDNYKKLAQTYAPSKAVEDLVTSELSKLELQFRHVTPPPTAPTLHAKNQGEATAKCGTDSRTLYAHAGLAKRVTYVYTHGDSICFTYGDCLEEVERNL